MVNAGLGRTHLGVVVVYEQAVRVVRSAIETAASIIFPYTMSDAAMYHPTVSTIGTMVPIATDASPHVFIGIMRKYLCLGKTFLVGKSSEMGQCTRELALPSAVLLGLKHPGRCPCTQAPLPADHPRRSRLESIAVAAARVLQVDKRLFLAC